MVKSKLSPHSGCVALRQLNPIHEKGPYIYIYKYIIYIYIYIYIYIHIYHSSDLPSPLTLFFKEAGKFRFWGGAGADTFPI